MINGAELDLYTPNKSRTHTAYKKALRKAKDLINTGCWILHQNRNPITGDMLRELGRSAPESVYRADTPG